METVDSLLFLQVFFLDFPFETCICFLGCLSKHSYKIQNGIVYLVVCQDIYPKKLAKVYIEAIEEGFMEELRKKYGSMSVSVDYHSKIETIDEPYHFMKFGKLKMAETPNPITPKPF